ncbi:transglycosylase [Thermus scotoductus]|uniref:Transglycosylase n=1 Tax=Thermus scotoductus TaxID=37636 RepID=A0A430V831_THESC|nr:transglycosylase SLT domain-containing protein [Thermus scotoductus]RTI47272.1 transglycosylase [Thermus scotoductus]
MRWLLVLSWIAFTSCRSQALPEPFASLERGVAEEVRQVALGGEGYARMLSGWLLVDREEVPLAERAEYAWRYALFLEGVKAFEPGWEAKDAWRKAARLLLEAQDPRAFSAWERLLPEREAVEALLSLGEGERLWLALFRGRAYEALLKVLPEGVRPDLRAQALFRLGRYGEALPFYREWARRDPRGYLGLGYALWRLGRRAASPSGEHLEEALEALARYDHPESRYAQGRILEEMGRILEAVEAYRRSTPEGLWRAAGILERQGLVRQALALYLDLGRGGSPYADDAALRAYFLAGELGLAESRREALNLVQGGLGLLLGKEPPPPPPAPSPSPPPEASLVEALVAFGKEAWARGVVRYALWQRPQEWPALVPLLYRLGAYREGIRAAWPTALAYPRPYREWVEGYARREGLDPNLLYALLHVESRFDPLAVSPTGALGLGQFLRSTWEDVARMLGEPPADPFDPEASIRYAARYLRWLMDRCAAYRGLEQVACAVTAYNGGVGYTLRGIAREGGLYAFLRFQERDEPREYLAKVLSAYAAYRAIP